jgi:hypothetical protein
MYVKTKRSSNKSTNKKASCQRTLKAACVAENSTFMNIMSNILGRVWKTDYSGKEIIREQEKYQILEEIKGVSFQLFNS